jgi:hypothetical protein
MLIRINKIYKNTHVLIFEIIYIYIYNIEILKFLTEFNEKILNGWVKLKNKK